MKHKRLIIISVAAALLIAAIAVAAILILNRDKSEEYSSDNNYAAVQQVAQDAQAIVNGDADNVEEVARDIQSLGAPAFDDANMMFVLAKLYLQQENKIAAQYYLSQIDLADNSIDERKVQDLARRIEALPDPIIEDLVNI